MVNFYPSITRDLLNEALALASQYIMVSDQERDIIQHARKSFLFLEGQAWAKKGDYSLSDATMGLYDGAETCELVGLLILTRLVQYVDKANIGLYRDDGLSVLRDMPGPSPQTDAQRHYWSV